MSGGGGGGGTTTSTTTSDVPKWMRGYMENVLGKAQTISNDPYQKYTGPSIAGFTPNQTAAFDNIANLHNTYAPTQQAALDSATQGANTASGIFDAGAGNINASTGYNPLAAVAPYLGASSTYDAAAAGQPWLNAASNFQNSAATAGAPGGIMDYMSPYMGSVVQGIQDTANMNWNQNIMPGINDKFVGSGQYGSGRNAEVLGRAAGNFQTGLSSNISNALQSGYGMASDSASRQAQLLAGLGGQSLTGASTAGGLATSQIGNLLNQAKTGADATAAQAQNLQNAGTALGNLKATQGAQELAAGTTMGNLAQQTQQTALTDAQAQQAVGQQEQQLNQSNLDLAKSDYLAEANHPKDMTEWMAGIIRGLPATNQGQTTSQNPAYSISPLAALGGAGATALTLSGNVNGSKRGGLIKGYQEGGVVDVDDEESDELSSPLDAVVDNPIKLKKLQINQDVKSLYGDQPMDTQSRDVMTAMGQAADDQQPAPANPLAATGGDYPDDGDGYDTADSSIDYTTGDTTMGNPNWTKEDEQANSAKIQRNQLLSIARGMLTPTRTGSVAEAFGNSIGDLQEYELKKEALDISRDRTRGLGGDPSNIREWKQFQRMSPEQKQEYLGMKRASQMLDLGGTKIVRDPVSGGAMETYGVTLKPGEKPETKQAQAHAEKVGEATGAAEGSEEKKYIQAPDIDRLAKDALKILPQATSGGLSADTRDLQAYFGSATKSSDIDSQLNVIGNALTAKVPRFEGPQSNYDVQLYKDSAGDLANPRKPRSVRIAAANKIIELNNKYMKKEGVSEDEDTGAPPPSSTRWVVKDGKLVKAE